MNNIMIELLSFINQYCTKYGTNIVYGVLLGFVFILILFVYIIGRHIKQTLIKRKVCRFFDLSDLDKFEVRKMGKSGTVNYREDGVNSFNLSLPHWKYMLEDGSKDKVKLFNRVVWEKSILWLHAGKNVYVVSNKDPWDMIYLVQRLRESGLDIAPCQQELDKQDALEQAKKSCNKEIYNLVQQINGDKEKFVELCRERLLAWGYNVADAPQNTCDIDLFVQRKGRPSIVRCLLISQGQLINLDDLQSFKKDAETFFAETCMLITTGSVTVAAAGYARENKINIISGEQFVEFLQKDVSSVGKGYLDWGMTNSDIISLLDDECADCIFN